MSIRLSAFDLDGTLLKEDKTVSGRTMAALQNAADRGIYLALLKTAGRGMAMANADPEVLKATAHHTACTNEEDGVAIEIETCLKEV